MSNNLTRFNHYMNFEFMSSPHGTAISMEELESMSLRSLLYALTGDDNPDANADIKVFDVINLIEDLDHQGKMTIKEDV